MENTLSLLEDPCTASHRTPSPSARRRLARPKLRALAALGLALVLVAVGCEEGGGRPVSAEVTAMAVNADCDSGGNPGDFDLSLRLYRITEAERQTITLLDEVVDVRYTLSDGDVVEIFDVWVEGEVPESGAQSILVEAELFEDDGGGNGPIEFENIRLDWDPDEGCWIEQFGSRCAGTTGELYRDNLVLSNGSGCNVVMAWRVLGD